ncbi:MAG: Ldh family oxidoreductase [Anderseniella sp.]
MKTETIKLIDLRTACIKALKTAGCDDANADAISGTVCAAERDHCYSHGILRMPGYLKSFASGKANPSATPTWEKTAPGVIRGDGDNGFAPLSLNLMADDVGELAKQQGVACLALTNMHHFAALWPEMELMTRQGLVAMTMTSAFPIVPPPGGGRPLFGTNPIAFGWPRDGGEAVIFDMATAARAHGEILMAAREGKQLPPGTIIDKNGNPSTDPADVKGGAILAFGGAKGALVSMMVELMAGALMGEPFSFETAKKVEPDGLANRGGQLIIAIDPARFGDAGGWAGHAEALFAEMINQDGVRMPSQRRYEARRMTEASGTVDVASDLLGQVKTAAG